jgi:hypothetical protein
MSKLNLIINYSDFNEDRAKLHEAIKFYKPLNILLIGSYSRADY